MQYMLMGSSRMIVAVVCIELLVWWVRSSDCLCGKFDLFVLS